MPVFDKWVTAYYAHGETVGLGTRFKPAFDELRSTLHSMSAEERAACTHRPPGKIDGGSDTLTMAMCAVHGVFAQMKDDAFYVGRGERGAWDEVEMRLVWCDMSIWPSVWAARMIAEELKEAASAGKATRPIGLVRLRGKNHFVSHSWFGNIPGALTKLKP